MFYEYSNSFELMGYSDSDWAIGFVFYIGDTTFTWSSNKKPIVTLSTCEVDCVTTVAYGCYSIWIRRLLKKLWIPHEKPTKIYADNSLDIALSNNLVFHDKSKHIDTRFHNLWDFITNKEVEVKYVNIQDQVVDIFTKPLKYNVFAKMGDIKKKIKFHKRS